MAVLAQDATRGSAVDRWSYCVPMDADLWCGLRVVEVSGELYDVEVTYGVPGGCVGGVHVCEPVARDGV